MDEESKGNAIAIRVRVRRSLWLPLCDCLSIVWGISPDQ